MTKKGSGKFEVEKPLAKGLPPGWTKEIRVKKKGGKTRKDPYYIDPESGQVFRSLKDVSRYLETKECSETDHGLNNIEAAGSLSSLPSEAEELKAGDSKSSDEQLAADQRKEEVVMPSGRECCMPLSPGKKGAVKERNDMLEVSNEDDSSPQCQFVSDHTASEIEDVGNKSKTIPNRRKKLHESKGPHLPLRTSKRLAGIKADSSLELKTNTNSHHQGLAAAPRQKGQTEAGMTDIPMVDDTHGNERKHEAVVVAAAAAALPPGKPESSSLMMRDVWMDPCIEFAIKTLTGAIPCIGEEENKADKTTPQSSLISSAGNLESRVEELPFGGVDICALDPCIEFAAKIVTGEIPISVDVCTPEKPLYKQQQKCWLTKFSSNQPIV